MNDTTYSSPWDDGTPSGAPSPGAPRGSGPAPRRSRRGLAVGAGAGAAGLLAGVALAASLTAGAATTDDSATASPNSGTTSEGTAPQQAPGFGDPTQPQRTDEKLLTGTTADKVKAAALAKYPDATVQRIESDSDGVYEAHLLKADGTPVTVEVDASFVVTGEEAHGPGGPGGRGRHDDSGTDAGTDTGTTTGSSTTGSNA